MQLSIRLVPQSAELRSMAHAMAEATRIEEAEAEAANNDNGQSMPTDVDDDDDSTESNTNESQINRIQELIRNLHRDHNAPVSRFDSDSSLEGHVEEVENTGFGTGNASGGHTFLKGRIRGWRKRVSGLRTRWKNRMKKVVGSMRSVKIVRWWKRQR